MKDKELRKLIGSRIKQRRLELNLTQPYVAEKMGVTASTILHGMRLSGEECLLRHEQVWLKAPPTERARQA